MGDVIDWSKAPAWADRHVWEHGGRGQWLGHRVNDWVNTYPMWESEFCDSGIPMPEGWDIYRYVLRPSPEKNNEADV